MTIGRAVAAIYRNIQMMLSSKLSNLDIKNGQHDFLYVISLREGISQKQLSEQLYIGKSTTAKAVKNLIGKGYVRKEKDKIDKRVDHLYLTKSGREAAPVIAKTISEILSVASRGLSHDEQEQLLRLLVKVLDNIVYENSQTAKGDGTHE